MLRKYDPAEWGGTETHVVELTRRLRHHGYPSEVHAPRGPEGRGDGLAGDVPLRRYQSFLPFVASRERRRALWANAGNIVSLHEPWRLHCDRELALAHLHTLGRIGAGVRCAMRLSGRPYIVSVHGPLLARSEWLRADTARRLAGSLDLGKPFGLLFGTRRVLADAALIITFNEEERTALSEHLGDETGTRVVRLDHGVDLERLASGNPARSRARWQLPSERPVILLLGRLCAQKNQVLAVRAFALGAPADWHLVLAGAATDLGYREQVVAEIERHGVNRRVHLLGNVESQQGVPDLMALASLLLVPSTHEAFGLAVIEGWAAGRAVLFANHSGLADLAQALAVPEATVADHDPARWAAAIRAHCTDAKLRARSARAGEALVRSRFNWDVVVRKTAELYDQVLETQRVERQA